MKIGKVGPVFGFETLSALKNDPICFLFIYIFYPTYLDFIGGRNIRRNECYFRQKIKEHGSRLLVGNIIIHFI